MSEKVLVVNTNISDALVDKIRRCFPDIVRVQLSDNVPADEAFVVDPASVMTQDLRTGEIRKPFAL